MLNTVLAEFAISVKNHLCIRTRGEAMSLADKLLAQLNVIEDFSVECNPQLAIHGGHRLRSGLQVDYAEPRMGQASYSRNVYSVRIGTAVQQGRDHPAQPIAVSRCAVE